jgi:hypothetical protein
VNAVSDTLPFPYAFVQDNTLGTVRFVDGFAEFLVRMQTDGLNVSGVTSDGGSFQVKALNWRDPESIQAQREQFSKLLFIPCICQTLQNATIALSKENAHHRHLIEQARAAAVYLRPSEPRAEIGGIWPAHCATRWIYD